MLVCHLLRLECKRIDSHISCAPCFPLPVASNRSPDESTVRRLGLSRVLSQNSGFCQLRPLGISRRCRILEISLKTLPEKWRLTVYSFSIVSWHAFSPHLPLCLATSPLWLFGIFACFISSSRYCPPFDATYQIHLFFKVTIHCHVSVEPLRANHPSSGFHNKYHNLSDKNQL